MTPWTIAAWLLCPWDSPDKDTRVGCHALLQGIFPTQGLNLCLLCLLHWQACSLPLVPTGKPYYIIWITTVKKSCIQMYLYSSDLYHPRGHCSKRAFTTKSAPKKLEAKSLQISLSRGWPMPRKVRFGM